MLQNIRLERIMDILIQEKAVDIQTLAACLGVTPKTVRLDLEKLENAHFLKRVHGGAILPNQTNTVPLHFQRDENLPKKALIARKALEILHEGDVILLDDGSTSLELAKLLSGINLTVLTNDVFIINELMSKSNIDLYVIGGSLKRNHGRYVITGEDPIQFIKKYRVSKLFLGISTIDTEDGLMIFYYGDRSTKRAFMAAADEVICLADSSKFGRTAFTRVAGVSELDTIITDSGLPEEEAVRYRTLGIRVIYADK